MVVWRPSRGSFIIIEVTGSLKFSKKVEGLCLDQTTALGFVFARRRGQCGKGTNILPHVVKVHVGTSLCLPLTMAPKLILTARREFVRHRTETVSPRSVLAPARVDARQHFSRRVNGKCKTP